MAGGGFNLCQCVDLRDQIIDLLHSPFDMDVKTAGIAVPHPVREGDEDGGVADWKERATNPREANGTGPQGSSTEEGYSTIAPSELVALADWLGGQVTISIVTLSNSNAPMSVPSPTLALLGSSNVRAKPRWSMAESVRFVPASSAGLPQGSAWVGVG